MRSNLETRIAQLERHAIEAAARRGYRAPPVSFLEATDGPVAGRLVIVGRESDHWTFDTETLRAGRVSGADRARYWKSFDEWQAGGDPAPTWAVFSWLSREVLRCQPGLAERFAENGAPHGWPEHVGSAQRWRSLTYRERLLLRDLENLYTEWLSDGDDFRATSPFEDLTEEEILGICTLYREWRHTKNPQFWPSDINQLIPDLDSTDQGTFLRPDPPNNR